jgi:hypothetical protein
MHYHLIVTARLDRDESCNLFTLTESKDFGIECPTPLQIKEFCREVKERFTEAYPHNQGIVVLVPIDAEVKQVAADMPIVGTTGPVYVTA